MLQEEFPDLSKIYTSDSLMPGMFAMDRQEGAQRSQLLNQASALQDLYLAEQMNPLKVRQQQLQNDTSLAQLPGFQADSSMKQDKAKISRETVGLQLSAQQRKLLADASDDDVKLLENAAQHLAYSSDPAESAKGQQLLQLHKLVIQEKSKQKYMSDRQLELEKLRGKNALDLANVNNAAGRYNRSSKAVLSLDQAIDNAKSARERHQKLLDAATLAKQNGDEESYSNYMQRAEIVRPQAEAEISNLQPKPGTPELNKLGIQTNPSLSIAPKAGNQGPDIKELVQKAGGQYEPDKYEYRVVDGKVQRRAKQ